MTPSQQPSRRNLLRSAAAGAIAAAVGGPLIMTSKTRAETKGRIYGKDAHTYEVIDNWGGDRPGDKPWGNTHMVQEVADGRIFVHHTGPQSVHVFDPDGKFIEAWGDHGGAAHGMDLRKEGSEEFLYFAPTGQHRIVKTDLKGEQVFECGVPTEAKNAKGEPCYGEGRGRYVPTFIAFAPGDDGDFYVADGYGNSYVHRYNSKGEYQSTFGGKGKADGELDCPHGIYCDARDAQNPTIVVADRANHRLQWFTLDGKHLKTVTDELRDPCHFDIRGTDLLIPDLKGRVTIFDKDNKLITHLGDNPDPAKRRNHGVPKDQLTPGDFCTPHGACWDRAGNIYVAEWLPYGRVTKLRRVS